MVIGIADGSGDLTGCFHTLYPDRQQPDSGQRVSLIQNPQHIMNRGACGAGDDADGARKLGNGLFMGRVKQALGLEFLFQLLEGGIEVTDTVHGHGGAVELISAVPGKYGNLTHGDNLHAVLRPEAQPQGIALEHDALQSRGLILQGKIVMPGGIELVVADFALHSHVTQQGVGVQLTPDIFI